MTMPAQPATPPAPPEAPPGGAVIPVPPPDAAAPPAAPPAPESDFLGATPPAHVTTVPPPTETPPAPSMRELMQDPNTVAAVEQARREERDRLHNRLQEQQAEIERLKPLAEWVQQQQSTQQQAEEEQRQREEAERRSRLSAEDLINEERQRFEQERAQWTEQQERMTALFEAEQRAQALEAFRSRRIAEEENDIAPQFLDYIAGNTEEEIENAITLAKTKTASIVQEVAAAGVAQRQTMRGVAPTGAPPAGPMDTSTGYQTLTADDIRDMDHSTYMKNRGALLEAARRSGPYGQGTG